MANAGVDGFEIGMPFSDPLADGPTIQAATQIALENGITVRRCLDAVRELRGRGVRQPMLMMGYLNPILAYGPERFVQDAKAAGADGLIVPDLPPEEADLLECDLCGERAGAGVFPGSDQQRRANRAGQRAHQRVYLHGIGDGCHRRADRSPARLNRFYRTGAHADRSAAGVGFRDQPAGTGADDERPGRMGLLSAARSSGRVGLA